MRQATTVLALFLVVASGATGQTTVGTGVIEGLLVYEGEAPPPTIVMEGGATQHVLYIGQGGGLRHAVASLGAAHATAAEEGQATLRQAGFIFEPQVLAVREGQTVRFTNEDGANHTVRGHHEHPSNRFDIYTGAGQMATHTFRATAERPAVITCDIHSWMIAWIYAFAHPYFAVTDETGRFRIPGVPAGLHQLSVRQPAGGLQREVPVRVRAGETTRVNIRFASSEVRVPRRPAPGPAVRDLSSGNRARTCSVPSVARSQRPGARGRWPW